MNLRSLLGKNYYPLNKIQISKSTLLNNYSELSTPHKNIKIAPVLKSNAYGHGLVDVAKILDKVNAPFFCVDSIYEAYELIKKGIKTKILIMGYVDPKNLNIKNLPFSYAVFDKEMAAAISRYQPHAEIHIFVDTGMHREGIQVSNLEFFLQYIKSFGNLNIVGLMSHFAESENPDNTLTKMQIMNFIQAKAVFEKENIYPKWIHIGNSSAMLNYDEYKNKIGNLVRSGIAIYGIDPAGKNEKLNPVLELNSTLCQIKKLSKGKRIGYSFTYRAEKDKLIGILPIGYFDGVDRRLSNKGFVKIGNVDCPIIGRVSMNLTIIDLSSVKKPQVGQIVNVYSSKRKNVNSIFNSANMCKTIPYDILVGLSSTTKRVVI